MAAALRCRILNESTDSTAVRRLDLTPSRCTRHHGTLPTGCWDARQRLGLFFGHPSLLEFLDGCWDLKVFHGIRRTLCVSVSAAGKLPCRIGLDDLTEWLALAVGKLDERLETGRWGGVTGEGYEIHTAYNGEEEEGSAATDDDQGAFHEAL
jgi:hypothetical protein